MRHNRKNTEPLVSVVLPTYDRPEFLRGAVESVTAQTYGNVELIVVDDCSPTPAVESLDGKFGSSLDLRVLRHEENEGANVARNNGIRAAEGEYVAFLDDDDRWKPEKVERQVEAFEAASAAIGVVCVGQRFVNENGEFTQYRMPTTSGRIAEEVFRGAILGPFSTVMVRADVIEGVGLPDERFRAWQDWEWHVRLAQSCEYAAIREPLVIRRIGSHGQISDDFEAWREAASLYLGKHRSVAAEYGRAVERQAVAGAYASVASVALVTGHYRGCVRYSLRALRHDPLATTCYAYLAIALGGSRALETVRTIRRTYHRSAERFAWPSISR